MPSAIPIGLQFQYDMHVCLFVYVLAQVLGSLVLCSSCFFFSLKFDCLVAMSQLSSTDLVEYK